VAGKGAGLVVACAAGVFATVLLRFWAKRRRERTGRQFPLVWAGLMMIVGLPLVVLIATGFPIRFESPSCAASTSSAACRSPNSSRSSLRSRPHRRLHRRVVRRHLAVPRGQTEAALALGLRRGRRHASSSSAGAR
jgi:general L-amino acid transport system permease protein